MSTRSVVPLDFNSHPLRVIPTEDGLSFWAVAKDACAILGLDNVAQAISRLDEDEKGVTFDDTPGGKQQVSTVSESGLYALVIRSNKPEAKAFRKWITAEVLPQIRRTGREYRKAMAHIGDLTAQLQRAHKLALASDQRLSRIVHYANKGLNGAEVAKLTDVCETTTRRLIKELRAAGLINDFGDDAAMILSALGSGLDLSAGK